MVKDHLGNKYETKKVMCSHYGLCVNTYDHRRKQGWGLERALTSPKLSINQKNDRTGERKKLNGVWAEIVRYGSTSDIDVKWDDGAIRKNVQYGSFKKGELQHPTLGIPRTSIEKSIKSRTGKKKLMRNGLNAEIVKYTDYYNIVVKFEDGTEVTSRYDLFEKGCVRNPNVIYQKHRVGDTKTLDDGSTIKIVERPSKREVIIEFEDGVRKNISIGTWCTRTNIKHPYAGRKLHESFIGMSNTMTCGMNAKIINFRSATDIDVEFEDGTISRNKFYANFKIGQIGYPNMFGGRCKNMAGFEVKRIGKIKGETYYFCTCNKCKEEEVLTPHEMVTHVCKRI